MACPPLSASNAEHVFCYYSDVVREGGIVNAFELLIRLFVIGRAGKRGALRSPFSSFFCNRLIRLS